MQDDFEITLAGGRPHRLSKMHTLKRDIEVCERKHIKREHNRPINKSIFV